MSKFKKKKDGGLPAISTASLPDIVFMLLFSFHGSYCNERKFIENSKFTSIS